MSYDDLKKEIEELKKMIHELKESRPAPSHREREHTRHYHEDMDEARERIHEAKERIREKCRDSFRPHCSFNFEPFNPGDLEDLLEGMFHNIGHQIERALDHAEVDLGGICGIGNIFRHKRESSGRRARHHRLIPEDKLAAFTSSSSDLLKEAAAKEVITILNELSKNPLELAAISKATSLNDDATKELLKKLEANKLVVKETVRERYFITEKGSLLLNAIKEIYLGELRKTEPDTKDDNDDDAIDIDIE